MFCGLVRLAGAEWEGSIRRDDVTRAREGENFLGLTGVAGCPSYIYPQWMSGTSHPGNQPLAGLTEGDAKGEKGVQVAVAQFTRRP